MTSRAMQTPHNLPAATGAGSGASPAYSPSKPAATIEEPATDLVRHSISPNTRTITRANHEKTAMTAPIEVATPLPPRPLRKGDSTCPKTVARPTAYAVNRSPSHSASNVGTRPLRTSSTPTTTPHRSPRTRPTLVAPGLPEPWCRSAWRTVATMVAGLTDPKKKPSTAASPRTIHDSGMVSPGLRGARRDGDRDRARADVCPHHRPELNLHDRRRGRDPRLQPVDQIASPSRRVEVMDRDIDPPIPRRVD